VLGGSGGSLVPPDPAAYLHTSPKGIWWLLGFWPKLHWQKKNGRWKKGVVPGLGRRRHIPWGAQRSILRSTSGCRRRPAAGRRIFPASPAMPRLSNKGTVPVSADFSKGHESYGNMEHLEWRLDSFCFENRNEQSGRSASESRPRSLSKLSACKTRSRLRSRCRFRRPPTTMDSLFMRLGAPPSARKSARAEARAHLRFLIVRHGGVGL